MKNTESTCTSCGDPIRNLAAEGRPDLWDHITTTRRCIDATPPHEVAKTLPRETRRIRIRVEEMVSYEVEKEFEVHVGVAPQELAAYLASNDEQWSDDIENHFFDACEREVHDDHTFFADDAGYLAKLAIQIDEWPTHIVRWLTLACPVCGVQPAKDDTAHQNVGYFVAIACNGTRLVDPGWIGMDGTGWEDWTKPQAVDASGKAGS
ncbi:hypothetical protein [Nonomuraea cavernae]|uniref:Uncharacterized protein n=1 Tax=Nonomuraea cavernae TaxID=2045107 RepID=A0A918DG38_9ACTN|nr:hypothetical protein [Nonomuraea cavernae]MCA2184708.1 hypothetical protein [Nonomuraea cavernae]GGO62999.1 hypothetical protein GCM10012289_08890 [Nonomuraea cavernae]